jgi:hypothetical protein
MLVKASQEEQMLLYRLDREVVNLPSMTNVLDESGKLAERGFGSVTRHDRPGSPLQRSSNVGGADGR